MRRNILSRILLTCLVALMTLMTAKAQSFSSFILSGKAPTLAMGDVSFLAPELTVNKVDAAVSYGQWKPGSMAYSALQAGQQFMVQSIKPYETNNSELYSFVLQKVTELGFSDVLRFKEMQMLGHQIGIDCHEFPMVNKASDFVMKPGMVFASEPKMWIQDEMYMRVEDIILVTEDGAEFLTNFPRDMFEI